MMRCLYLELGCQKGTRGLFSGDAVLG